MADGGELQLVTGEAKEAMEKSIGHYRADLRKVRTGRANAALLDGIQVDYYGTPTPLNQLANLNTPDPRLIVISPYDKGSLQAIEKAIQASDLGLTPANDGKVVRIPIPPLTEERRKQLVKRVKQLGEEGKTAVRQIRRDSNETVKSLQKDGDLSEDDAKRALEAIQKLTDRKTGEIDELCSGKEKELMEV